jgi:hypothetical protein
MSDNFSFKHLLPSSLSLFTSAGTLICCALPALFVSLGMGATLAGLTSSFPAIVWLSRYKLWVFGIAALMIVSAGVMMWRARNMPCPTDPRQAKACALLRKASWWIWGVSVASYIIGIFFAFIAPIVLF